MNLNRKSCLNSALAPELARTVHNNTAQPSSPGSKLFQNRSYIFGSRYFNFRNSMKWTLLLTILNKSKIHIFSWVPFFHPIGVPMFIVICIPCICWLIIQISLDYVSLARKGGFRAGDKQRGILKHFSREMNVASSHENIFRWNKYFLSDATSPD